MTTFCKKCDSPYTAICDFCSFYCFNSEWVWLGQFWRSVYRGMGFCYVDMLPRDPEDTCEEFYCFTIKKYGILRKEEEK